jgi:hypothetical protein
VTGSCDSGRQSSSSMKGLCPVCRNCFSACVVGPRNIRNHLLVFNILKILTIYFHIRDNFYIFNCSCVMKISDSDLV